jgi:hypothetical protein
VVWVDGDQDISMRISDIWWFPVLANRREKLERGKMIINETAYRAT